MKDVLLWLGTHATAVWLLVWALLLTVVYVVQCAT
jgi:hypothetical protein